MSPSADGKILATAGADGTVRVWEVDRERELRRVRTSDRDRGAVALSPDGKRLAVIDGNVRLRDVSTGREIGRFGRVGEEYHALAFAPDGKVLAAAGRGSTWRWDIASGKELRLLDDGGWPSLAFSARGDLLATGSAQVWKLPTGKPLLDLGSVGRGRPFSLSRDGKSLALGGEPFRKQIVLYEVNSGKVRRRFDAPCTGTVALAPARRILAIAEGNEVILRDLAADEELLRLKGHRGEVNALAFPADGKTLFSGSADTTVLVWGLSALRPRPLPPVPVPFQSLPTAQALARVQDASTPVLLTALAHPEPEVRTDAIRRLAEAGPSDTAAVAALVRALREKDGAVRRTAFQVLGSSGPFPGPR